jgi:hypothetical protein
LRATHTLSDNNSWPAHQTVQKKKSAATVSRAPIPPRQTTEGTEKNRRDKGLPRQRKTSENRDKAIALRSRVLAECC